MDTAQILVTVSGVALIAVVLAFFFGPRRRRRRL
jgi:LPXTG-motif cell wall-anchored protein